MTKRKDVVNLKQHEKLLVENYKLIDSLNKETRRSAHMSRKVMELQKRHNALTRLAVDLASHMDHLGPQKRCMCLNCLRRRERKSLTVVRAEFSKLIGKEYLDNENQPNGYPIVGKW